MARTLLIGLALSALLSLAAYQRGSLSRSGAVGALLIGTSVYLGGGWAWFATLCAFFFTATLLGRVGLSHKAETKAWFSKSDRRDIWQTLANGGLAAAAALVYRASGGDLAWAGAFVGALAACNADTWATELGILSTREPWLLTTFERVPRGTSGGISPRGLAASAAGGATIGLVPALAHTAFHAPAPSPTAWVLLGVAAGLAGSLADSLLGATVQATYYCPACAKETERLMHGCGAATEFRRGQRWLQNDWVNALASVAGACVGLLLV